MNESELVFAIYMYVLGNWC